nr:hypothetical protein XLIUZIGB_XLIUZIGB_CDS_0034 [Caudoviricetes sp.]
MNKIENYLGIANHDIQMANNSQELKSYVASILCENDELQQENQKYKEVIDKVSSQIKLYGKYNGEKCTRGFSVMTADFNKLLDILKEVE